MTDSSEETTDVLTDVLTEEEIKSMNVYQRVHEIRKRVNYIQKDKTVDAPGAKYNAVTHDNVTALTRQHFIDFRVMISVQQSDGSVLQFRDGEKIKMHLYQGTYHIWFTNIDDPQDKFPYVYQAHGSDTGDKAPGKAHSYAMKYAVLKVLQIESGDDEEGRYSDRSTVTEYQIEKFHELVEAGNALPFLVFSKEVGQDVMVDLHNSFPQGKKTEGKELCRRLEEEGNMQVSQYAIEIHTMIDQDDQAGAMELWDELDDGEKRLVWGRLSIPDQGVLKQLKSGRG